MRWILLISRHHSRDIDGIVVTHCDMQRLISIYADITDISATLELFDSNGRFWYRAAVPDQIKVNSIWDDIPGPYQFEITRIPTRYARDAYHCNSYQLWPDITGGLLYGGKLSQILANRSK